MFIRLASILVLFLLIFSAYSNTFQVPPVLDDIHSFVEEPKLQVESFTFHNLKALTKTSFGYNRVLPEALFAWDFYWGKGHISAFHVTNLVIHFICVILVLFLFRTLFESVRLLYPEQVPTEFPVYWLVFFMVGVWALNPVQTNAVTYLVQRMASMAAMFYLLSFSCYLKARIYQQKNGKRLKSAFFYMIFCLSALCAFLSKQNTAMLPVMVVIAEMLFFTPDFAQRILRRKILFGGTIVIAIFVGYWVYTTIPEFIFHLYDRRDFTLEQRLLTEMRVVSSYVMLLVLPLPRFLNLEHDVTLSTSLFSPLSTLFSFIFLVCLFTVAWKMRHRQRLVTFGIMWFFANLVIESTIIPLELKFEHRVYLPSVGFYLAMSLAVIELVKFLVPKKNEISTVVIVSCSFLLFSIFSSMTYVRNACWSDNISLYSDCVQKAPTKARNHCNLGQAYAKVGKYNQALAEAELALTYGRPGNEEYWAAASNIIFSHKAKGELIQAISKGKELLLNAPKNAKQNSYPVFLINLGKAYVEIDDYRSAYDLFLQARRFLNHWQKQSYLSVTESSIMLLLQKIIAKQDGLICELGLQPDDHATIYGHMAFLSFESGQYEKALGYCKLGLDKNLASEKCNSLQTQIKMILAANKLQQQKGTLKDKYFFNPFQSRFNYFMAMAYLIEKMDIPVDGLLAYCLNQAERLNSDSPDVHLLRSWQFYQKKNYEEALKQIDRGIQLDPEYAHLWINRGIYALADGQGKVALSAFKKSLSLYPGYPHKNKVIAMITAAEKLDEKKSSLSVNCHPNGGNNG